LSKVNTDLISWTPFPPSLPPFFQNRTKEKKSRAPNPSSNPNQHFQTFCSVTAEMIAGFVDKSITTEPKQVAVWATAASSSSGTHPPGHPPARSTSSCVRAQILFSNKLWFFPPSQKISTTLSLTFFWILPGLPP